MRRSLFCLVALTVLPLALFQVACSSDDEGGDPDATASGPDADPSRPDAAPGDPDAAPSTAECNAPTTSACGNLGSLVRGVVTLAAGTNPDSTSGTLFVALTHRDFGDGAIGGSGHAAQSYGTVDLSSGSAKFELDMCSTAEMWSETYGLYNLVIILDTNGDQGFGNFLPDEGEAAHRLEFNVNPSTSSPCEEIALDCVAGASCTQY